MDVVASYQGFDLRSGLEDYYADGLKELEKRYYKSAKRYSGQAFRQAKLKTRSSVKEWDAEGMFEFFDRSKSGVITPDELRHGMRKKFGLRLKQWEIDELCREEITIKSE